MEEGEIMMSEKDLGVLRRFIEDPHSELSQTERDLCVLLYLNYDQIEKTSFHIGIRPKLIAKLITENKRTKLVLPENSRSFGFPKAVKKLSKVKIKSFRGFQEEQEFHFGHKFTFIYGRNGTGKSSLVDAIEFSLLNNIQEAKYKRIDVGEYIKNIYTRAGIHPKLYGLSNDGSEIEVAADPEAYNFAIIERNRIENFARLSAETASIQQQRLAALVGLDSWNEFVNNFSKDIDKYLPFEDELNEQIAGQQAKLTSYKDQLSASEKSVQDSEVELKNLLTQFDKRDLDELKTYLSSQKVKLNGELSNVGTVSIISEKYVSDIIESQSRYLKAKNTYLNHQKEMSKYKNNLSLVDLANAILEQQRFHSNNCPACLSQIRDEHEELMVPEDPYTRAKGIKVQYDAAVKLERKIADEKVKLESHLRNLIRMLQTAHDSFQEVGLKGLTTIERLQEAIEIFFTETRPYLTLHGYQKRSFQQLEKQLTHIMSESLQKKVKRMNYRSRLMKSLREKEHFKQLKRQLIPLMTYRLV